MDNITASYEREDDKATLADSIFYLLFVMLLLPLIPENTGYYFTMQFLPERDLMVLGLTGSFESLTGVLKTLAPIGVEAVVSKMAGRRDWDRGSVYYSSALTGQLILCGIVTVIMIILRYPIARLMGAADAGNLLKPTAVAVIFYSARIIPDSLFYLLSAFYYLDDRSRRGILYGVLSGSAVTIAGQMIVTWTGPSLAGYYMAGLAGSWAVPVVMILYKRRRKGRFCFNPFDFHLKSFAHVTYVGLPGGAEYLYYMTYQFAIYRFVIHRFSPVYLSVFEVGEDLSSVLMVLVTAMCSILVYRIGVVYGSGIKDRMSRELKNIWRICIGGAMIAAIISFFLFPFIVDVFVGEKGSNTLLIRHHAVIYLLCTCAALPFYTANNIFSSVYEVREMMKECHLNYFLENLGFLLLFSLVFSRWMGITGVWVAYPAAEAVTLLVNMIILAWYNHRLPRAWIDFIFPERDGGSFDI